VSTTLVPSDLDTIRFLSGAEPTLAGGTGSNHDSRKRGIAMILVFGSTGTTGRGVARHLIAGGIKPRLLVRDPVKAKEYAGKAEIVQGDLERPESLAAAMKGVEKMFLVSAGLNGSDLEIQAIDAARKAGVKHVVKLSVIGAESPVLTFSKWHAKVEKHLMANAYMWADTIRAQGAFYMPTSSGRWAAVDPADIGAVAATALTSAGHEGKGYTLTGPESMNAAQYAAVLSSVLGKPVKFVDVPPEAARDAILKAGIPPAYVDAILDLYAVMKAGKADVVTDTVEKVTGKKAGTFEAWAKRNAAGFQ
jgi:uncharacterized protein YbjT (DUF2867 family)